ncbi:hypothetical protein SODALDRAFT_382252 [Sodiomyces alkalinus F11]|uniref:Uncharacterized protein n=1 Tax=Sodiomyces alkalinus (strain CBS 110278 / VKM F-3762 / F11) TaxID=1314773 RepID=A0A3N2PJG8_SODAK|nr:hypothetical protein SODALDRAFT_382252 [Sodiomyces alkalinus F11]ROT34678.1 hypothetical protein SODALDRAFT_382252 [Sodiomyces alkalinus F11]
MLLIANKEEPHCKAPPTLSSHFQCFKPTLFPRSSAARQRIMKKGICDPRGDRCRDFARPRQERAAHQAAAMASVPDGNDKDPHPSAYESTIVSVLLINYCVRAGHMFRIARNFFSHPCELEQSGLLYHDGTHPRQAQEPGARDGGRTPMLDGHDATTRSFWPCFLTGFLRTVVTNPCTLALLRGGLQRTMYIRSNQCPGSNGAIAFESNASILYVHLVILPNWAGHLV